MWGSLPGSRGRSCWGLGHGTRTPARPVGGQAGLGGVAQWAVTWGGWTGRGHGLVFPARVTVEAGRGADQGGRAGSA